MNLDPGIDVSIISSFVISHFKKVVKIETEHSKSDIKCFAYHESDSFS